LGAILRAFLTALLPLLKLGKHKLRVLWRLAVRSQPISGNGGHDNYGRGEKASDPKVNEIGVLRVASSCGGSGCCA